MRLVIIGNSGSGKSTLAGRLAASLSLPAHDLDLVHWEDRGLRRDEAQARAMVRSVASGPGWIVEGVYGWLAEVALARATGLAWLDLPWPDCRDGLLRRGLRRGMTPDDAQALLAWAGGYRTRATSSSFAGHARLHDGFGGRRWRLRTRREVSAFHPATTPAGA